MASSSGSEQDYFMLKWENYHDNISSSFQEMRADGDFLDTTVVCDERHQLQAHKVILSASSPYFKSMLKHSPAQHPVLVMPNEVRYADLLLVIQFIYHGEVRVPTSDINSFMKLVQLLKLKGLTEDQKPLQQQQQPVQRDHLAAARMPPGTRMVRQASKDRPPKEEFEESEEYYGYSSEEPQMAFEPSEYAVGVQGEIGSSSIQLKGLVCPICKAMCQDVSSLKDHMFIGHGIQRDEAAQPKKPRKRPAADTEEESIACRFCDKKLKNRKSLIGHEKRLHRVELGMEEVVGGGEEEDNGDHIPGGKRPRGRGKGKRKHPDVEEEADPEMLLQDGGLMMANTQQKPVVHVQPTSRPVKEEATGTAAAAMSPPGREKRNDAVQVPRQKILNRSPSVVKSPSRPASAEKGKAMGQRRMPPKDLQSRLGLKFGGQISITSADNSFKNKQQMSKIGDGRQPVKAQAFRKSLGQPSKRPVENKASMKAAQRLNSTVPAAKGDREFGDDDFEDEEEMMGEEEEEEEEEDEEEEYGEYAEDGGYYDQGDIVQGDVENGGSGNLDGMYAEEVASSHQLLQQRAVYEEDHVKEEEEDEEDEEEYHEEVVEKQRIA